MFILIGIIFNGWIPTGTVGFHDQNSKPKSALNIYTKKIHIFFGDITTTKQFNKCSQLDRFYCYKSIHCILTFPHTTDIVCSPFALLKGNRVKLNVMNTTKVSAGSASKYDGCLQCRDGERVTTENINMQQCCFAIFLVQGCPVGNAALTSATCISAQDCTFKKAKFWKKCLPSWTNFLSLA